MSENFEIKDTIEWGQIKSGEWGTYSGSDFERRFRDTALAMPAYGDTDVTTGGYSEHRGGIRELLQCSRQTISDIDWKSLYHILRTTVPRRREDIRTGHWDVECPIRDDRPGVTKSRIPSYGPDVYKSIILGTLPGEGEIEGHALLFGADYDEVPYDHPFSEYVPCRDLSRAPVNAFVADNRFQAYIRCINPVIVALVSRLCPSLINYDGLDSPATGNHLTTLPYGITTVTFPKRFSSDLSDVGIFDLFSMLKATQQAIRNVTGAYRNRQLLTGYGNDEKGLPVEDMVTNVFINLGSLAGGTIPRLHIQVYMRARTLRDKCYERRPPLILRPQHDEYMSRRRMDGRMEGEKHLLHKNRSCNLFALPVPGAKYETKIEPKDGPKPLADYNDTELWDLAEMLTLDSLVLDRVFGRQGDEQDFAGKDRNVMFHDSGVVMRPFAFVGGMEQGYPVLITPISAETFEHAFDRVVGLPEEGIVPDAIRRIPDYDIRKMYRMPNSQRDREAFLRLRDHTSPFFVRATSVL